MNEPIIYIPEVTPSIEDMMLIGVDTNTPKEDVKAILALNDASCLWFHDELETEYYLDLVEDTIKEGVDAHLDRLDRILRSY